MVEKAQRISQGWAARDQSGALSPYSYTLRSTGPEDVLIKIICCGICHSDVHLAKNDFGFSNYPMVPGHEVVGKVEEIGCEVRKVRVGDYVGVGYVIGSCKKCELCNTDNEHYCDHKIAICNHKYTDGNITRGGFATSIVVDQRFTIKIPNGMAPEQVAPLLCSGITVYSPLIRHGLNKSGLRGGILGLGGIGHMGVIIAKTMGHHVTVISSSENKREEALQHLGADVFLDSSDTTRMLQITGSLDYLIDTLPVFHHLETFMRLLKIGGKLIQVGAVNVPLHFSTTALHFRATIIAGTFLGSVKETEELIKLFHEKGVSCKIEVIKMDYVNTAFERLLKNDVRYKFVIDVAAATNLDS